MTNELTDEQREEAIREVFRTFPNANGPTVPDVKALLRLLDAERAKVAEADRKTRAQSQKQTRADRMRKYDPTDLAAETERRQHTPEETAK